MNVQAIEPDDDSGERGFDDQLEGLEQSRARAHQIKVERARDRKDAALHALQEAGSGCGVPPQSRRKTMRHRASR